MKQAVLFLFTVLIMCVAGFWQSDSGTFTPARWLSSQQGLYFGGNSMAYTERFVPVTQDQGNLTIDLSIKPELRKTRWFSVVLEIYDLRRDSRIVIGQWNQSLVVLNSDDFSNRQRQPKIYAPLSFDQAPNRVSVQSNQQGTRLYINDRLQGINRNLKLALPASPESGRLVLGNDISGKKPWQGSIQSLSISNSPKDARETATPDLHYSFTGEHSGRFMDSATNSVQLLLPRQTTMLKKEVLQLPGIHTLYSSWMWRDMLLNFFGFIPFGILLGSLLSRSSVATTALPLVAITTVGALLFSLTIEMTQVVMPTRNSSLLDLTLNTAGGLCGSILIVTFKRLTKSHIFQPWPAADRRHKAFPDSR